MRTYHFALRLQDVVLLELSNAVFELQESRAQLEKPQPSICLRSFSQQVKTLL